jgi:AAHS family 4-hydroxybenzoate transporter-like MFS transporter
MVGALVSGPFGDRFGRKLPLIFNALVFALFTLATPFAHDFSGLFTIRFGAGLGLGGATPCFLALMSDYAPRKNRATLVSLLWAGFPVGATLGGFLNGFLISTFGWTAIFFVGGAVPLVVALVLWLALPEAPQFLVGRGRAPDKARRILDAIAPGAVAADSILVSAEEKGSGVRLGRLFDGDFRLFTPMLWGVFAFGFGTLTVFVLWAPALLKEQGMAVAQAAIIVAWFNLGAVVGQGAAGRLVDRFGPLAVLAPGLLIGAAAFAITGMGGLPFAMRGAFAIVTGAFLGLGSSGARARGPVLSKPDAVDRDRLGHGPRPGRTGGGPADRRGGAGMGRGRG